MHTICFAIVLDIAARVDVHIFVHSYVQMYDADDSGFISREELAAMLKVCGCMCARMTRARPSWGGRGGEGVSGGPLLHWRVGQRERQMEVMSWGAQ